MSCDVLRDDAGGVLILCSKGPRRKPKPGADLTPPPAYSGITIYTDGAIVPRNPGGHATWAWLAYGDMGEKLGEDCGSIGEGEGMTNNLAEFTAALNALRWAYKEGHRDVTMRSDSQLLVNQASGLWSCNSPQLHPLMTRIRRAGTVMNVQWQWITREQNTRADALSRKPYEEIAQKVNSET